MSEIDLVAGEHEKERDRAQPVKPADPPGLDKCSFFVLRCQRSGQTAVNHIFERTPQRSRLSLRFTVLFVKLNGYSESQIGRISIKCYGDV